MGLSRALTPLLLWDGWKQEALVLPEAGRLAGAGVVTRKGEAVEAVMRKGTVKMGQLHADGKLASLMSTGAKCSVGPVRLAPYLPSSHPVVILQDVTLRLSVEMEREGMSNFKRTDVRTLLQREKALINLSDDETYELAGSILEKGIAVGIFEPETGDAVQEAKRTYKLTKRGSLANLGDFVEDRYIEINAERLGKVKAAQDYIRERGIKYGSL